MGKKQRPSVAKLLNSSRFSGKYVAYGDVGGERVVEHGTQLHATAQRARNKGVETPTIIFVPKEGVSYLY